MTDANQRVDWEPLRAVLQQHRRYVVTSHVRPDGDALGSALALAELLRFLGKEARIVNADATPPRLRFLDPQREIDVLGDTIDAAELEAYEVVVVVDTGAWGQLGSMGDFLRHSALKRVVVDHHAGVPEVPALILRDATCEATGRLVYDLARYLEVPLSSTMARALFVAIATDTGWFRFPSTTSSTYDVVSELVAAGAVPHEVFRELYERDTLGRIRLRGIVLARLVLELEGRLAHTYLAVNDFAATGALPSETEDFVNMALTIDGTQVAVIVTEQASGRVKVSLRSRGAVDCSALAATLGGGGHKAAAGATMTGTLELVQQRVLEVVRQAMTRP